MKIFDFLFKLVGNKKPVAIAIFTFIAILCLLFVRCTPAHGAEVVTQPTINFEAGTSFDKGYISPVIGLDFHFPQGKQFDIVAGTMLWGSTPLSANNWDWSLGIETCRWRFCASIGAAYVQRVDYFNSSHANYNLRLAYQINKWRIKDIRLTHLSNAGTFYGNTGRDAIVIDFDLD